MKENHPIYKEEREQMKKITGFKKGYYIRIIDGFYEVIDGTELFIMESVGRIAPYKRLQIKPS